MFTNWKYILHLQKKYYNVIVLKLINKYINIHYSLYKKYIIPITEIFVLLAYAIFDFK